MTSSWGGARRALPYAFTEQGIAMLSSILKSKQAIDVNMQIFNLDGIFQQDESIILL